jgi:ubiquinone/menaquinone biosynthesis C-methylase UbiE
MSTRKAPKTDWGNVADWYDQLVGESGSEYHQQVVVPGVLRLLQSETGQKILDVACGQGVLCRILAERGAEVTGVDAAAELIAAARQRGPASIRYHVADAQKLDFLGESHFDSAACILAIQNEPPSAGFDRHFPGAFASRAAGHCDDAPLFSRTQGDQLGLG